MDSEKRLGLARLHTRTREAADALQTQAADILEMAEELERLTEDTPAWYADTRARVEARAAPVWTSPTASVPYYARGGKCGWCTLHPGAMEGARKAVSERREHVVGDVSEFPEGSHRVVRVGRRQIGVFNIRGELFGLPNVCPHQTGPLCEGKPPLGTLVSRAENDWRFEWVHEGEVVVCPWHGLEYHVPTGQCLAYPNILLRRYEVIVEDGKVKVRL